MQYIKNINISMVLLSLTVLKLLFSNDSYAIAITGLGLTGLYAYSKYLKSKVVKPLDEEVKQELSAMRNQLSAVSVKTNLRAQPQPGQKFF